MSSSNLKTILLLGLIFRSNGFSMQQRNNQFSPRGTPVCGIQTKLTGKASDFELRTGEFSDQHIGIIGAGPAGIAAAWFLMKKKGYKNVTVLEAADDVGGKCRTVEYTDSKGVKNNYELGAEYVTYAYDTIFEFINAVGETTDTAGEIKIIQGKGKFELARKNGSIFKILPAALRYLKILKKYEKIIDNPSNAGIAADSFLCQSSEDFITSNNLDALKPVFIVKQFGYGSFDSFAAIDLMRTIPLSTFRRIGIQFIPIVRSFWKRPIASLANNGIQSVFRKMANELDREKAEKLAGLSKQKKAVLTGEKVTNISKVAPDKSPSPLLVETTKGKHTFDRVICAVPADVVAGFVDFLSDDMKNHMKKIKYNPYYVGFIDKPKNNIKTGYYQNLILKPGEPVEFSKRWKDSAIMAYGYNYMDEAKFKPGNKQGSEDLKIEMKQYLKDNMRTDSYTYMQGGVDWENYHPHAPIKDLQTGYYDKLEAYQGTDGVFLTGDGMALENLNNSCKHARLIVDKFF